MKKYLEELKAFYFKYRLWIIGGLFFLIMMQVCSQGGRINRTTEIASDPTEQVEHSLEELEPLTNSNADDLIQEHRKSFNSEYLLLLMGLGLLYYIAFKRKWFHKLAPSILWVSLKIKNQKEPKSRLARMTVINKTKNSITLDAPVLVFGGVFKKSRKFRLKSGVNSVFPLVLTPDASHKITIDIDQFRQKAGVDKSYNLVKTELTDSAQKIHSSFWKLLL
nr:hypothetical protein [uncultured Carboxylicivirga sp.]